MPLTDSELTEIRRLRRIDPEFDRHIANAVSAVQPGRYEYSALRHALTNQHFVISREDLPALTPNGARGEFQVSEPLLQALERLAPDPPPESQRPTPLSPSQRESLRMARNTALERRAEVDQMLAQCRNADNLRGQPSQQQNDQTNRSRGASLTPFDLVLDDFTAWDREGQTPPVTRDTWSEQQIGRYALRDEIEAGREAAATRNEFVQQPMTQSDRRDAFERMRASLAGQHERRDALISSAARQAQQQNELDLRPERRCIIIDDIPDDPNEVVSIRYDTAARAPTQETHWQRQFLNYLSGRTTTDAPTAPPAGHTPTAPPAGHFFATHNEAPTTTETFSTRWRGSFSASLNNTTTVPTRKEPPMTALQIPHPGAVFDQTTPFLFYNNRNGTDLYIQPAGSGYPQYDTRLHTRAAQDAWSDTLLIGNNAHEAGMNSRTVMSYCRTCHWAGLPLATVSQDKEHTINVNPYHLFVSADHSIGLRWDADERMQNLHKREAGTRDSPDVDHVVVGTTLKPVYRYYESARGPLAPALSVADAWDMCSDAWRDWATNHSPVDTRLLLLLATQMYPYYFALESSTQVNRLWFAEALRDDLNLGEHLRGRLLLSAATYNPDQTLTLYRTAKELEAGRPTTTRVGKALRAIVPPELVTDDCIKKYTAKVIGHLTPPEFRIGYTKADFDLAYTKGPSSCMTYGYGKYKLLEHMPETTLPTDALINGDIGVAMLIVDGRVTARALVVASNKQYPRVYAADYATSKNDSGVLERQLSEAGYTHNTRALYGQKLRKIEVVLPAVDDAEILTVARDLMGISRQTLGEGLQERVPTLSREQRLTLMEALDIKAFVAPYIDHSNPPLIEHDEYLEVSGTEGNVHEYVESPPIHSLHRMVTRSEAPTRRLGRSTYSCGGVATCDYARALTVLAELLAEKAPAKAQTGANWVDPFLGDITQGPTEAPRPGPGMTYNQRLLGYAELCEEERDNEDESDTWLVFDTANNRPSSLALTEEEAGDCPFMTLVLACDNAHGSVWADEDDCYDLDHGDASGEWFLLMRTEANDHVQLDNNEFAEMNLAVYTADGAWELGDDCTDVGGDWYRTDSDSIRYIDRCERYAHEDDAVCTEDGSHELAENCYCLPDGTYIHEDDLQRAG